MENFYVVPQNIWFILIELYARENNNQKIRVYETEEIRENKNYHIITDIQVIS